MKRASIAGLASLMLLAGGCASTRTTVAPREGVALNRLKAVRVAVVDDVATDFSRQGVPQIEGLVKEKLTAMGHAAVESGEQVLLEIRVKKFTSGSKMARLIVGSGAGEARIAYEAKFVSPGGELLAAFEGGKGAGMPGIVGTLSSEKGLQGKLIRAVADQVEEFLEKNGGKT